HRGRGRRPAASAPSMPAATRARTRANPSSTRTRRTATIGAMANPDRLTALDTAFLHLEDHSTAHMHVASVMVFEGTAPAPQELVDHVMRRLHLVPRYRQRLAFVPPAQGRPVWTDDPYAHPRSHIRHPALPNPPAHP